MKKSDLTGCRFGKLLALKECDERKYYGKTPIIMWECKCDCGNYITVASRNLKNGNTQSCGCYNIERIKNTKTKDLTGMRFGRLVVIKKSVNASNKVKWICQCDCGNTIVIQSYNLLKNITKSCGCYRSECISDCKTIHGESHTRLYRVWQGMKERCYKESHVSYYLYGGRGIRVCDEWLNSYISFKTWAESNGYDWEAPRGQCTLDRKDVNGDYCPENCRWSDMKTQSNNRRNSK